MPQVPIEKDFDLICVGAGIMSATLALMLKFLDPKAKVIILERLDETSLESSAAINNAGTGHSGYCELNYTPEKHDGSIDVTKAIRIFEQFERSKQFWTFLVKNGYLSNPHSFIHPVPHYAWVKGEKNIHFLEKRHKAMTQQFMFDSMKYTTDQNTMREWFPLIMKDRKPNEKMAATRMDLGTEVNFGNLTRQYLKILKTEFDVPVLTRHEVIDVDPGKEDEWLVAVKDLEQDREKYFDAAHVFIGAGGGALPLLQKVEIEEKEGYGGFPISGQWLFCKNRQLVEQHHGKVYSKAEVGSPPMSVPHLDTRYINGKKELMFGPFAGFSTKFLKEGSSADLPKSINFGNIPSLWGVFWHNLDLTRYLIDQVRMNHEDRIEELRVFLKNARPEDWEMQVAGQRVQVIKRDEEQGGVLEFGTDLVHSRDGSITALLGASPGASVAIDIMLEVINKAFPEKMEQQGKREKLEEMIPFWNRRASSDREQFLEIQKTCTNALGLTATSGNY